MGIKTLYRDRREKIIQQLIASKDIESIRGVIRDHKTYKKYSGHWKAVNLDEFISKFNIKNYTYNIGDDFRKISFYSGGKEYEIVAAVGGKYFRIRETPKNDKRTPYLDINLKQPRLGKLKGKEAAAEGERLTHFRMTYKKGTV